MYNPMDFYANNNGRQQPTAVAAQQQCYNYNTTPYANTAAGDANNNKPSSASKSNGGSNPIAPGATFADRERAMAKARVDNCNTVLGILLGNTAAFGGNGTNTATNPLPRIALTFSGGGWRAMSSAVTIMDVLSTPLDTSALATDTFAPPTIKLFDTVSHIFALSGGSWAMNMSIADDKRRNVFHTDLVGPNSATSTVTSAANPWLYGSEHFYDERTHHYEGLLKMRSPDHLMHALMQHDDDGTMMAGNAVSGGYVDPYNYNTSTTNTPKPITTLNTADEETTSKLRNKIAQIAATNQRDVDLSTLIGLSPPLGYTKVQSWGEWVTNQLLTFMPNGTKEQPISRRTKQMTSMRQIIADGDFPYVVASSIGERTPDEPEAKLVAQLRAEEEAANKAKYEEKGYIIPVTITPTIRKYHWVEFSPYFIRNPTRCRPDGMDDPKNYLVEGDAVDNCGIHFFADRGPTNAGGESLIYSTGRAYNPDHTIPHEPLRLHRVMGLCSSAFAWNPKMGVDLLLSDWVIKRTAEIIGFTDMMSDAALNGNGSPLTTTTTANTTATRAAAPNCPYDATSPYYQYYLQSTARPLTKTTTNRVWPVTTPFCRGTLTGVQYDNFSDPTAAKDTLRMDVCHDAGNDINVPFPAIFEKKVAKRQFDIIIVCDGGEYTVGAADLATTIKQGWVELVGEYDADTNTSSVTAGMEIDAETGKLMPHMTFDGTRFKMYELKTGEILLYQLALTVRSSWAVVLDPSDLLHDIYGVKRDALKLQEGMLKTLYSRFVVSNKNNNNGGSMPAILTPQLIATHMASQTKMVETAINTMFPYIKTMDREALPSFYMGAAKMLLACRVGDGDVLPGGTNPNTKNSANDGAAAAAAAAKIGGGAKEFTTTSDLYLAVERIFDTSTNRQTILTTLEQEAVRLRGATNATATTTKSFLEDIMTNPSAIDSTDIIDTPYNLLFGLVVLSLVTRTAGYDTASNDTKYKYVAMNPAWADYYAAIAVTRQLIEEGASAMIGTAAMNTTNTIVAEKAKQTLLAAIGRGNGFPTTTTTTTVKPTDALCIFNNVTSNVTTILGATVLKLLLLTNSADVAGANATAVLPMPLFDIVDSASNFITQQYLKQMGMYVAKTRTAGTATTATARGGATATTQLTSMIITVTRAYIDYFATLINPPTVRDVLTPSQTAQILNTFVRSVTTIVSSMDSSDALVHLYYMAQAAAQHPAEASVKLVEALVGYTSIVTAMSGTTPNTVTNTTVVPATIALPPFYSGQLCSVIRQCSSLSLGGVIIPDATIASAIKQAKVVAILTKVMSTPTPFDDVCTNTTTAATNGIMAPPRTLGAVFGPIMAPTKVAAMFVETTTNIRVGGHASGPTMVACGLLRRAGIDERHTTTFVFDSNTPKESFDALIGTAMLNRRHITIGFESADSLTADQKAAVAVINTKTFV